MFPSAGDERLVKPAGLLVAAVAFLVTRGLLVDLVYGSAGQPLGLALTRLLPVVLGLGVVVLGVSLAVSTRDRSYVQTVAVWYILGILGMLVLVGVAVVDATDPAIELRQSRVVGTVVVGGGVGGILVGLRTANNRQYRRTLERQADQSVLANRLLRHEVLNALTAIRGHVELLAEGGGDDRSYEAVANNVDRIEGTVEDVGFIVRTDDDRTAALGSVDVLDLTERCLDRLPDAEGVTVESDVDAVRARADDHLETVVAQLVTTPIERADVEPTVAVSVGETTAKLVVSAPGEWLNEGERDVLVNGLTEYDSPDVEFGVSITRLLVAQYGGTVDVDETGRGTSVTVELLRVGDGELEAGAPGVDSVSLRNAAVAGLVAGSVMGAILQVFSGEIGVIGGLYGLETLAVGWTTHLFHSVVFAVLFAAIRTRYRLTGSGSEVVESVASGLAYSLILWLVAAGVVMGVWLNVVGIPSDVPNLGAVSLVGHVAWGVILGVVYGTLAADT